MTGLIIAALRVVIHTQVAIIQHLIFLHKAVGSIRSNYTILETHSLLLNGTLQVFDDVDANAEGEEQNVSDL